MEKTNIVDKENKESTKQDEIVLVPSVEHFDKTSSLGVFYKIIKRAFDIFVSIFGIIFLAPLSLGIKIASIIHKDKGSIFYKQKRIGYKGREFTMYKYRTMVHGADELLDVILNEDEEKRAEYQEHKKLHNDPRITKVGKFLRRSSLDEFPQMLCIFTGKMTLVGNRPYLPREKKDMGEYFDDIVKTKPGLTGYWQVNGRSGINFQKRLELEQYYSNHAGLFFDIKIILSTFKVVLGGKGAK